MILPEIARQVQAAMRARSIPVTISYGRDFPADLPEYGPRIRVFAEGTDIYGPPVGAGHQNGSTIVRSHFQKQTAVRVLVTTQSTKTGAGQEQHDLECEALVDAFLIDLDIVTRRRRNPMTAPSGQFLLPEDDPDGTSAGSTYEITFVIGRPVTEESARLAAENLVTGLTVKAIGLDGTEEIACGNDA